MEIDPIFQWFPLARAASGHIFGSVFQSMYHAIFCTDNPGGLAPRLGNRPDRPAYWSDFSDKPVSAGPTPDADGKPNGSLIVMDFASREEARALADADPRAKAGIFEGVVVCPWGKTLPADRSVHYFSL